MALVQITRRKINLQIMEEFTASRQWDGLSQHSLTLMTFPSANHEENRTQKFKGDRGSLVLFSVAFSTIGPVTSLHLCPKKIVTSDNK
jgi:hypothetical protein